MPNLRIGFRNIFDPARGCVLTASPALVTTLPVEFLTYQARNKCATTTSTAAQDIKASWTEAQIFNYMHTKRHNLTAAAQQRIRTYTDSVFSAGTVDNAAADCFGYTGFSVNDVLTEADFRLLKNSTRYVNRITDMKSLNSTYTDVNNPQGWMEFSRIFGGEYYEFEYQIPGGMADIVFDDYGTQSRAEDGSIVSNKGPKGRKLQLASEWFTPTDWKELLAGQRYCGYDRDFFLSLHPTNGTYLEAYNQGLWKFEQMSPLSRKLSTQGASKLILVEC